jgi:hypothetical protein
MRYVTTVLKNGFIHYSGTVSDKDTWLRLGPNDSGGKCKLVLPAKIAELPELLKLYMLAWKISFLQSENLG